MLWALAVVSAIVPGVAESCAGQDCPAVASSLIQVGHQQRVQVQGMLEEHQQSVDDRHKEMLEEMARYEEEMNEQVESKKAELQELHMTIAANIEEKRASMAPALLDFERLVKSGANTTAGGGGMRAEQEGGARRRRYVAHTRPPSLVREEDMVRSRGRCLSVRAWHRHMAKNGCAPAVACQHRRRHRQCR